MSAVRPLRPGTRRDPRWREPDPREETARDAVARVAEAAPAPRARSGDARATPRNEAVTDSDFDPYWNHRARWVAFYLLPFGALAVGLHAGWVDLASRDFWVPALWGLWMPWFNGRDTPLHGLKAFVFRDFNQNEYWPLGVPVMHAVAWSAAVGALGAPAAAAAFALTMLLYDAWLLKSGLLHVYGLPGDLVERGWPRQLAYFGLAWWPYVALGFFLSHVFGHDSPWFIAGFAIAWIAPMQIVLSTWTHRPRVRPRVRRVAVIGAGWAGIYATRWLRDTGLDVRTFERGERPGGVWAYRDAPGGVARGTFASSSKDYMHASDFPFAEQVAMFPGHEQVLGFLDAYVEHFGLRPCMRFGAHVQRVQKRHGRWLVHVADDAGGDVQEFDAVVVTAGANGGPSQHPFPRFRGTLLHAGEFKDARCIDGHERVLIVGVGESGADIAHECAQRRTARVTWSGGPQWFADRYIGGGHAADAFMAPGIRTLLARVLNLEDVGRRIVQSGIGFFWGAGGSDIAIWKPRAGWLHGFVTKSRDAIVDVHEGLITAKGAIVSVAGRRVTFDDGSEGVFDLIIDCTGYAPRYEFLDRDVRTTDHYKLVFDIEDPTLAFVGAARPVLGSIPALAELQARWVASVYGGRAPLPPAERMRNETRFAARIHRRRFYGSARRPNLVDHEFYASDLAARIGIRVPWLTLLVRHPVFFVRLLAAPWLPFKYNLADRATRRDAMAHIVANAPPRASPFYVFLGVFWIIGALVLAAMAAALAVAIPAVSPALWIFVALMAVAHALCRRADRVLP